jgi:hypothetical protein
MTAAFEIATYLDAPADRVWEEMQRPRLLLHVAAPLMTFRPVDPPALGEVWRDGAHVVSLWLGGVLPLGRQIVDISRPPAAGDERFLLDDGRSPLVRRWHHLICVARDGAGTTYADRLRIDASWRTAAVAAFARRFYRHRQERLRRLAASGFDYAAMA